MTLLVVLLVVLAVVAFVGTPLRSRARGLDPDAALRAELAELEVAKEAKYHEIRDAELDQRTGKLSEADHRQLDGELRAEAIALLKRTDAVRARLEHAPASTQSAAPPPAVG